MKYTVHRLELHRDIMLPETGVAPDGTIAIREYRSLVQPNNLEPDPEYHLREGMSVRIIPAGFYLFAQGFFGDDETEERKQANLREAAEAVWLESLWRETSFKNEKVLVRTLSEDEKTVFQIFREI